MAKDKKYTVTVEVTFDVELNARKPALMEDVKRSCKELPNEMFSGGVNGYYTVIRGDTKILKFEPK